MENAVAVKLNSNAYIPIKTVSRFEYDGKIFTFKKPYVFNISFGGGYIVHADDKINLHVAADTLTELIESFYEVFAMSWDFYVECDDDKLGKDALKIKGKMKSICEVQDAKL